MMANFILKLKTRDGNVFLKSDKALVTIGDLKAELHKTTGISPSDMSILTGFPPKKLELDMEDSTLLSNNIISGDTLILDEKVKPTTEDAATEQTEQELSNDDLKRQRDEELGPSGVLMKRVVPADNSCLFTSIGFVFGGVVDVTCGNFMRKIIAEEVANDPVNYNEAILGRPNYEYCEWIQRPESWGGAIELAVLSKFYGMEIAVVDTVNAIINRFGEDQLYDHRVFLIFDGIHYDPLYVESFEGNGKIQTLFPIADDIILREAEALAVEAQARRQFTDLNKFTLKCKQCNKYLIGQEEALKHAKETGHSSFGETGS